MFAEVTTASLDWTALALTVLTGVLGFLGWAGKRFSGRLDKHMEKVDGFIGDAREHRAVVNVRLDAVERQINPSRQIGEIHSMVAEIHGGSCGVQQDLERRSA